MSIKRLIKLIKFQQLCPKLTLKVRTIGKLLMDNEKLPPQEKSPRKFTIQISMLISFLLVLMVACGSIIYYDYLRTSGAFLGHVDEDIREVTAAVVNSTVKHLEPAKIMAQMTKGLVARQKTILDDPNKVIDFSIQALDAFPQIDAFHHGDIFGNLIFIARAEPRTPFPFTPHLLLPANVAYSVHIVTRETGSIPSEYYLFKDNRNATIAVNQRSVPGEFYDPRVRPWFVSAIKAKQPIWTNPYVFAFSNQVGITAATPVIDSQGNVTMVLSADITVRELSLLLAQKKIGKTGIVFIFNDLGQLIGYPDIKKITKKSAKGEILLPTIQDTGNSAVMAAFKTFKDSGSRSFIQRDHGNDYIIRIIDITRELGSQAYIGFVAPKHEFTAEAERMTRTMIVFSIIIFILAAAMIFLISRNISKPIQKTARELVKIGNFDIDFSSTIESRYHEISLMNNALTNMKRSLRDFARFVPKAVVRKLIESGEGAELGGKKMNITLMFSNVKNLTGISEKISSEKLALHLSDYFDQLTQIIIEANGTIDKYIGGSIMAFWGAPFEDLSHPLHACRAVINCTRRLRELNKNWALEGKPPLFTQFGIHTGNAMVGNVGSKDRLNYSAFGDSVNLASQLEDVNKIYHTYMIISHDTFKDVRSDFICRPLDIIAVVGRAEGIRIYELMAERSSEPRDKFEQDQLEMIANLTTAAFELYLNREFKEAEKAYRELLYTLPDDYVAQLYIERCKEYQLKPPPKEWRGVYVLAQK